MGCMAMLVFTGLGRSLLANPEATFVGLFYIQIHKNGWFERGTRNSFSKSGDLGCLS